MSGENGKQVEFILLAACHSLPLNMACVCPLSIFGYLVLLSYGHHPESSLWPWAYSFGVYPLLSIIPATKSCYMPLYVQRVALFRVVHCVRPPLCQYILHCFIILSSVPISCRWCGNHYGPPSTSLFPSTPNHYPGIGLRDQPLVPWYLHASMAGFLVFDSRFTSLTSDQAISRMLDINSFIHILLRCIIDTLGIIVIIGDFPRIC